MILRTLEPAGDPASTDPLLRRMSQTAEAIVPCIPQSAPFSAEQRAWLNGFFAGLLGNQPVAAMAASSPVAAAPEQDEAEQDFPWHDPSLPLAERMNLAEGKPLDYRLMSAMAQLDCGACGYVCRTYSQAIAQGQEKDLTKCSPGGVDTAKAVRLLVQQHLASGGALGVAADSSNSGVGQSSGRIAAVPAAASPTASQPVKGKAVTAFGRSNPFSTRLLRSIRLTHAESPKDTRHVELDLADDQIRYEPGDALGILPENCSELVDNVVLALGASGGELVPDGENSFRVLRDVLKTDFTLARTRPALLELLGQHCTDQHDAAALRTVLESPEDSLAALDVAELLERFPSARPPLADFLAALAPLQPRLYSISSSLRAHPNQVHLTVGVVRFESLGRWRHGVASHFLGVRSRPGDEVRAFIQPSPRFRLPADSSLPIIMVGPGTGIAPFRAFLEEREATASRGKNWLFFGNQYMGYDYLYREQLEKWLDRGVLSQLDLAFSRDKAEKCYVQHRMLEHGQELWRWLQDGAHFYVCGDARRMAPDVEQALISIAITHGSLSPEDAKAYVVQLGRAKRYHKDVY